VERKGCAAEESGKSDGLSISQRSEGGTHLVKVVAQYLPPGGGLPVEIIDFFGNVPAPKCRINISGLFSTSDLMISQGF